MYCMHNESDRRRARVSTCGELAHISAVYWLHRRAINLLSRADILPWWSCSNNSPGSTSALDENKPAFLEMVKTNKLFVKWFLMAVFLVAIDSAIILGAFLSNKQAGLNGTLVSVHLPSLFAVWTWVWCSNIPGEDRSNFVCLSVPQPPIKSTLSFLILSIYSVVLTLTAPHLSSGSHVSQTQLILTPEWFLINEGIYRPKCGLL